MNFLGDDFWKAQERNLIEAKLSHYQIASRIFSVLCEREGEDISGHDLAILAGILNDYFLKDTESTKKAMDSFYKQISLVAELIEQHNEKRCDDAHFYVEFKLLMPGSGNSGYKLETRPRETKMPPVPTASYKAPGFKDFIWRLRGAEPRKVPNTLWRPTGSTDSLTTVFTVAEPWSPPDCSEYQRLRETVWGELVRKNPNIYDGLVWRLADARLSGNNVHLVVQQSRWLDYYTTNLRLDQAIRLDDGRELPIRDWLRPTLAESPLLTRFPGANPLCVNVLLITRNNEVAIIQQKAAHSLSGNSWVASVSGTVRFRGDSENIAPNFRRPNPGITAYNEVLQESGLEINPLQLKWVGFGIGLKMGSPAFLGEYEPGLSAEEMEKEFDCREEKEETKKIRFVPLDSKGILNVLDGKNEDGKLKYPHLTYFELAFALAAIKRGLAEDLTEY